MLRSIAVSLFGYVVPLAVAIPAIPYLIGRLGDEKFGLLAIGWTVIFIARACDFGVSAAVTRFASKYSKNVGLKRAGLHLILKFSLALQCASLVVIVPFYYYKGGYFSSELLEVVLIGSAAIVPMAFINFARAVLEADRRFGVLSALRAIYMPTNFLIPVVLVVFFPDINVGSLLAWVIVGKVVEAFHYSFSAIRLSFLIGRVSPRKTRKLIGYGKWIGVNSVLGPVFSYSDRFIASSVLSLSSLSILVPATEFINRMMVLPLAVNGVLFPHFSKNNKQFFEEEKLSVYSYLFINTMVAVFLVVASVFIVDAWLGDGYEEVASILSLMLVCWPLSAQNRLASAYLQARNRQKSVTLLASFVALVYLILLYFSMSAWGLLGAPLSAIARVLLVFLCYGALVKKVGEPYGFHKNIYSVVGLVALYFSVFVVEFWPAAAAVVAGYLLLSIDELLGVFLRLKRVVSAVVFRGVGG
jgi:O-antigen/teichoic acid export membrane protein